MEDVTLNISDWNTMDVPMQENNIYEVDFGERVGKRKIIYCQRGTMIKYRALDCTHPMQNMNLSGCEAFRWRPFIENRVEVEDAEFAEIKLINQ